VTRAGTTYLEISIVCLVMALGSAWMWETRDWALDQARDSAVRANLTAWNRALLRFQLANGGRLPPDLHALRPALVVERGRDPYRWLGSHARGHFALQGGAVMLVDDAGQPPAGRDARGRAYADYR
jgi:hypothetical protein